jgi:hypothetical protein
MSELSPRKYEAVLRSDLGYFAERCFYQLNPQAPYLTNWHIQVIAAKLTEVREGKIGRLIINLPPRHLKSLLASIAFPAWCLGHYPSAQILTVCYAQDLADKLTRDCRSIMMSPWYQRIFRTRLVPHRHAVQEFITTREGYRLATSTGGCTDRARRRSHFDRRSLETGGGAVRRKKECNERLVPQHPLQPAQRQASRGDCHHHAATARGRPRRPRARTMCSPATAALS